MVPPIQQVPSLLGRRDDRVGALVGAEAREHLVQDDLVADLHAVDLGEPLGEPLAPARSSGPPALRRRRGPARGAPPRWRSRARGGTTRARSRTAPRSVSLTHEVRGGVGHGGGVRVAVGAEHEASVVGHVQPLVPVDRPGVGPLDAAPRGGAWPGSPPPTGRRRRPRAPTRRDRSQSAVVRRGRRTRRCSRCPPARRRLSAGPCPRSSAAASASGSIAPFASAATGSSAFAPMPSSRSDRSIVAWRSSPASTRTGGAPVSPSASTSQPASASTRCRAAASATVFAPCAPVVMPNDASPGRPRRSLIQPGAHDLRPRPRPASDGVERHLVPAGREHVGARWRRRATRRRRTRSSAARRSPRAPARRPQRAARSPPRDRCPRPAAARRAPPPARPARPDARRGGRRPCACTPRRARRCAGARRPVRTRAR